MAIAKNLHSLKECCQNICLDTVIRVNSEYHILELIWYSELDRQVAVNKICLFTYQI